MSNKLETISNLFEGKEIRSVWDSEKEEYYFSVVDVIGALTESNDPSHYWRTLKSRMIKEGNETVTNCDAFKLKAKDGKLRFTDVLSNKLTKEFGSGFSQVSIRRMRKFYELYPIWSAVPTELSWSHFQELIRIDRQENIGIL